MSNWTNIINEVAPFVFMASDEKHNTSFGVHGSYSFPSSSGVNQQFINYMFYTDNLLGQSAFIYITNPKTIGPVENPSAPSPAAAQTADTMFIMWGKPIDPTRTAVRRWDVELTINDHPNLLVVSNLRKWYTNGKLHRKSVYAALTADYVGAAWINHNNNKARIGGPHTIGIENYQEFYKEGSLQGHRYSGIHTNWSDHQTNAAQNICGEVNPLSTEYCQDIQDRFMINAAG